MLQTVTQHLLSQWLPAICLHCRKIADQKIQLCSECYAALPWINTGCIRCGIPLPATVYHHENTCQDCLQSLPPFDQTIAVFEYDKVIKTLITGLKFHHRLSHAKLLGTLMADKIQTHYQSQPLPTCILPIPLHYRRISQRGFNQSIELAKPLAKAMHIPINTRVCKRIFHTKPQSILNAKERKRNVKGAFGLKQGFCKDNLQHVAIVDDVMTTTSTATELALLLKESGVQKIDTWCCARA